MNESLFKKMPFVWDMETSDPDDFMTLLLLLGHPRVDLRAVTITPGTPEQVGLVRWALRALGRRAAQSGCAGGGNVRAGAAVHSGRLRGRGRACGLLTLAPARAGVDASLVTGR